MLFAHGVPKMQSQKEIWTQGGRDAAMACGIDVTDEQALRLGLYLRYKRADAALEEAALHADNSKAVLDSMVRYLEECKLAWLQACGDLVDRGL